MVCGCFFNKGVSSFAGFYSAKDFFLITGIVYLGFLSPILAYFDTLFGDRFY